MLKGGAGAGQAGMDSHENFLRAQFKLRDFYRRIFAGRGSYVVKVDKARAQKLDGGHADFAIVSRGDFCLECVKTARVFFAAGRALSRAAPFDYDAGFNVVAGLYKKALEGGRAVLQARADKNRILAFCAAGNFQNV